MSILNEYNDQTKNIIHIMVTTLCGHNCANCCNKQYDLNDIPYVTDEELQNAETICLTGGEPFTYSNPCEIATHLKTKYSNIKNVYVYTSAMNLAKYLHKGGEVYGFDGVNISIKSSADKEEFITTILPNKKIISLSSNRLYVFNHWYNKKLMTGFKIIEREWQENFKPANDSIFRKI